MNSNPILLLMLPVILILGFGIIFLMLTRKKISNRVILVDAVYTFVDENGNIDGEMQKILDNFPNKKIILTNAGKEKFSQYCLDKMPYEVFTLEHNPSKIESEYYKRMLSNFGLTSEKTLYFEHNLDAVKSAESVGIKTMWFDTEKRDLAEVEEFLKENI